MSLLSTLAVAATVAAVVVAGASADAASLTQPKLVRRAAPHAKVALPRGPAITSNTDASWAEFKRRYGRTYASAEEEAERRAHFARNVQDAARHQAQNPHAVFGATRFGDWSEAELRSMRPAVPAHTAEEFRAAEAKQAKSGKVPRLSSAMAKKVDWREKGAVTPVKNQGQCGDCWSFSTTGNIEGQWKLAGHDLVSLSEQELTSCDTNDDGCNGGLPWNAMAWLIDTRGGWITSEKEYPFASVSGTAPQCQMDGKPDAARIHSVHRLTAGDEKGLAEYLAEHGPVSIGVTAESWQTYEGGILTSCGNGQIDHAVLAVGYDMDHSPPYWVVKNSWTTQWGEEGYIRLSYGSDMCKIAQMASSAIVA